MLVGDHTAMLAFLGYALPLGALSNTLLQLACLALVAAQNASLCATPVRMPQVGVGWGGVALRLVVPMLPVLAVLAGQVNTISAW